MLERRFFSIIVPVYKVEKYLHQCVDSLLAQDYDDFEVILVDDGSPDRCPVICDEYAGKSEKIKVVHKPNGGLSDARNAGFAIATGDYVTFVDSDDFWKDTDVLSGISKVIDDNNFPDIIVSDFIKYYEASDKYIQPPFISDIKKNGASKIEMLEYLYFCQADMKMSACQKFAKRELLTGIPFTKGLLSEDIDWTLKLYPVSSSICVYDKPYYCYRQQREGSITNTASQRSFDNILSIVRKYSDDTYFSEVSETERSIYRGYLAYQLSIAMTIYPNLNTMDKKQALVDLGHNLHLFKYQLNGKTKKVKNLINLIGLKNTCLFLGMFRKLRSVLQLG